MTSTETRYIVGDAPDDEAFSHDRNWCNATPEGLHYYCSRPQHHGGQHVAANATSIAFVWDNPASPDEPTEVEQLKRRIRDLVPDIITRRGYGDHGGWNVALKRLGIEPITQRTIRVVAPARRATRTGFDTVEQAEEYLRIRRDSLGEYLRVDPDTLDADAARVEVEEETALDESDVPAEADWRASTDDLATYHTLVQDEAARLQGKYQWCDDGVRGVLDELGVAPLRRTFRVQVAVRAMQTVYVDVIARDESEAEAQVEHRAVRAQVDNWSWSWDEEDWEVEEVNESDD